MQHYLVCRSNDPFDILNQPLPEADQARLFDTKRHKGMTYHFVLASAHDKEAFLHKQNKEKLLLVVSYVPTMSDPSLWASFYTNLCLCDVIVCDSFVAKQLEALAAPPKRMFLIDGTSPLNASPPITRRTDFLKILPLDTDKALWNKFSEYLLQKFPSTITVVGNPVPDAIGVAFYPLGPALAVYFGTKLRFVSAPFDDITSQYLDCRQNHRLNKQIGHFAQLSGTAAAEPIKEGFKVFLEELRSLVNHAEANPLLRFQSSHTLFDRVYHHINRVEP